jgi:hypothetical protein
MDVEILHYHQMRDLLRIIQNFKKISIGFAFFVHNKKKIFKKKFKLDFEIYFYLFLYIIFSCIVYGKKYINLN